ncbi:hypothetical protein [Shewanella youngdeokensis]|uniref:Cytochrome c7-like domain-containing protein n=1 Tax=Shewanella youngdeokensis TaxID=2999068 RepID=A0ABZ0JYC4_9GAMM|nr:hypothetical protein RGE70_16310 [Shewanella sp. DAU334]
MNINQITGLLLCSLFIYGCGSDDNNDASTPVPPVTPEETVPVTDPLAATGTGVFENVWGPDIKFELDTTIYAYLNGNLEREDMVNQFNRKTPANGIAIDPSQLRAAKAASYENNDGLYIQSDIFNDNQISFADVLLYLSQTRTDFNVEYQWNEELATYQYTVWHDQNNDGDFDDEGDVKADPNWYATYLIDFGNFKRELYYNESGEALYLRLEQVLVQPNSGLHFRSYSPMMTSRRESVQQYQADLKRASKPSYYDADTEVIVVPMVAVTAIETIGVMGGEELVFHNVEARSHNLRPDIFKKDQAITMADVLLSMREQGLIDVGFTFWGTLASEVSVQHFVINEINGSRSAGFHGYVQSTGVSWAKEDFSAKYLVSQQVELGSGLAPNSSASTMPTYCDHVGQSNPFDPSDTSLDHPDGIIDAEGIAMKREVCDPETTDITDWYADQESHIFSDVWVMNYPGDFVWIGNFTMYDLYPEAESKRIVGDEKWPIPDIKNAKATLDENHFGWGIADCGTCHSLSGIHVGGDVSTTLGVNPKPISIYDEDINSYPTDDLSQLVVAPYQCATCHGGNGAPKGHGESAACYWCHSEDNVPPNHGTASAYVTKMYEGGNSVEIPNRTYRVIDVDTTDTDAVSALEAELQEIAPIMNLGIYPAKEGVSWQGYWGTYQDDMKVRTNSSWSTDPVYPDPYACVTCHTED